MQITFENQKLDAAYTKLTELKARRLDVVLPIGSSMMMQNGEILVDEIAETFKANDHASSQIASKLGIPNQYFSRLMSEMPRLAAQNYNGLVGNEIETKGEKARSLMIRAYRNEDGPATMRALLSSRYLALDNLSILACALEVISKIKQEQGIEIKVDRCDLSETNMYVRFICPEIEEQAPEALKNYQDPSNGEYGGLGRDNGIVTGFILRNSEVGAGKFLIAPHIVVLACRNGMIFKEESYEKTHLGSQMDDGIYKDDTHAANMELIKLQIRDNMERYLNADFLGQRVADINKMAARKINNPTEIIQRVGKEIGLKENEIEKIFAEFISQRSSTTAFDVAQAMTGAARGMTADRMYEIQVKASEILAIVEKCDRPGSANSN